MAFKGTARRSARQIAEEIEAVGGDINAATVDRDHGLLRARAAGRTCRWRSTCCPTSWPTPSFEPAELAREQNVIVQEIGAVEDTPDDLVFEHLQSTAFPGQPVGRSILGTPETVRSFDTDSAAQPI